MTLLHWREPLWLLLAGLPLLPLLWRRLRGGGGDYAAPQLLPWVALPTGRRLPLWRDAAWLAGWLLLAVAASGPRLPLEGAGEAAVTGGTVVAVVDLSRSMDAADVAPNRRRRAALELYELLEQARGSRIGIVVYAARAHLYVPPSTDQRALRFYLETLDRLVLPTHGSRLAPALSLAQHTLAGAPGVVVLLGDGDFADDDGAAVDAAVRDLAAAGASLHVLGIGSPEGEALPLAQGGWLTDAAGRPVISRLDEARLAGLARLGGGQYRRVAADASDWAAVVSALPAAAAQGPDAAWRELYPWPLLPALLLLFLALMPYGFGSAALLLPLLLLPALTPPPAAAADLAGAYAAFQAGEYAAAAALYAELPGHAGRMGEGASRYRAGDYPAAARAYGAAVLAALDDAARADALFNLGGVLFRQGDYAAAVQVFGDVLRYRPDDGDARHNLALSEALWQAVQTRLADASAQRAGRGVRSGRVPIGTAVGDDVRLSLADAEETADLPGLPIDAAALVARGLDHVALAAGEGAAGATGAWQQDLAQARLRMLAVQDAPALLWQRLFEAEEGFPAPLREPRELPGVAPW